jgi:hypothetical protein
MHTKRCTRALTEHHAPFPPIPPARYDGAGYSYNNQPFIIDSRPGWPMYLAPLGSPSTLMLVCEGGPTPTPTPSPSPRPSPKPVPVPSPDPTPPEGAITPGQLFLIAMISQNLICRADFADSYIYCVEGTGETDAEQFQVFRPTGTATNPILFGESVVVMSRGTGKWCRMSLMVSGKQGILCDANMRGNAALFQHTMYGMTFNSRPLVVDGPGLPLYLGGAGAKNQLALSSSTRASEGSLVSIPSPAPNPTTSPSPVRARSPSPSPAPAVSPSPRLKRPPPSRKRPKAPPPSALSRSKKSPPATRASASFTPPPAKQAATPTEAKAPAGNTPPSPRITSITRLPNGTIVYSG